MSAASGKPLSDTMERAMIALADLARSDRSRQALVRATETAIELCDGMGD